MTRRKFGWRGAVRSRRSRLLVSFLAAAALSGQADKVFAVQRPPPASPSPASSSATEDTLPTVTVDAAKDRRELKRQVDHFVTSVVIRPWDQSLERWNTPICPRVDGLSAESNELIRARVLQAATAAHAPVAGKHCISNLYIIASDRPDQLLKKLWAHNTTMFYSHYGQAGVEDYLNSERPVRAWYNTDEDCNGTPGTRSAATAALMATPLRDFMYNSEGATFCSGLDSRLTHEALQTISSAIIVADMNRLQQVKIGQLADYVAMVALADVYLDPEAGEAPSILRLFQDPKDPPQGLSKWDRALLYSLYNTTQSNTMQVSALEATVLKRVSQNPDSGAR